MPFLNKKLSSDSKFISALAHDLKTPVKAQIQAVRILNSLLKNRVNTVEESLLLNILASNQYMQFLIDNVLKGFNSKGFELNLNKTKNDLRKTIENAAFKVSILLKSKDQKLVLNYLAEDYVFSYDEIEIERVFVNLITNSFEHGLEESDVEITVQKGVLDFKISIKNKTTLDEINNNENRLKTGSGLGLSICKSIIEAHGGEILNQTLADGIYSVEFSLPF